MQESDSLDGMVRDEKVRKGLGFRVPFRQEQARAP
jgi:hypothetical protein